MKVRYFFQYETQFVLAHRLVSYLCVLCALVVNIPAQDFKTIHDGVEYATVNYKLGNDPVKINLLRLDLKKVRLDVHHAMDAAIGTEKTSSIATRHGAVAAINAGFFRLDKSVFAGEPSGILKVDGELFSEGRGLNPSLVVVNAFHATEAAIVGLSLEQLLEVGKKTLFVGTNRERKESDLVEYTPRFGKVTPAGGTCLEMIVRSKRIDSIVETCGNVIPKDGYIVSASGEKVANLRAFAVRKKKVERSLWTVMDDMRPTNIVQKAEDVVSGRGHLLRDGKPEPGFSEENKSFIETRHPRTAVATMKDGKFLMITVDGRQPGVSVGMNLYELADYLLSLGAQEAMNLDGGGSTTMFLDGKVVNTPSDKEGERKVGDAILVTLRKKK